MYFVYNTSHHITFCLIEIRYDQDAFLDERVARKLSLRVRSTCISSYLATTSTTTIHNEQAGAKAAEQ